MRDTSLLAYMELKDEDKLGDRQKLVFDYLKLNPDCTDSEICMGLGVVDPNFVRPRRNELVRMGLVEENGKRYCLVTKRLAYVWRVI